MPETPDVKQWKGRVELARKFQDELGNTSGGSTAGGRWDRNIRAMAGDFNSKNELGEEAIDVNITRNTLKTSLTPLWLEEPHVTITPTVMRLPDGSNNQHRSELTEIEINYWLRELEVRRQVRKVVLDAEATNLGYLYLGFVTNKQDVEIEGKRVEPVPLIRHGQPFIRRHSPKLVLVPPGYWDLEDCPWVDIIFHRPLAYVRDRFPKHADSIVSTDRQGMKLNESLSSIWKESAEKGDWDIVEVHNCWDKTTGTVYIFTTSCDEFLEEPADWPYELEGFPLVQLRFEEIPDEFHATPPMSYGHPQQKELNATRTAMRKNRNRTKRVIFCKNDTLAQEAQAKYAAAVDGEIIGLSNLEDDDIRKAFFPVDEIPISTSDIAYDSLIKGDYRETAGLSSEQRGGGDPNIGSATASANVQQGVNIRRSERAALVRDLWLGASRKLWMILKQKGSEKTRRMVLGPRGDVLREVRFSRKELEGEFNFRMDIGAVLGQSPEQRYVRSVNRYRMFRNDPLMDPNRLILDVLQAENVLDPEGYMLQLKSPDEEFSRMQQGLPVEAHERDEHMGHLQAHEGHSKSIDMLLKRRNEPSVDGALRLCQSLIVAHIQDHIRIVQMLQGKTQPAPGEPIGENALKSSMKVEANQETSAEMTGQPLEGEMVS